MSEVPIRRQMSFTFLELLDRTFRIYRENFLTVIGVVAVITIPITIITYILTPSANVMLSGASTTRNFSSAAAASSGLSILTSILDLIQTVVVYASLTYLASEAMFSRKLSIGEALSGARDRFTKVGCSLILLGILILIAGAVAVFVGLLFPPLFALSGILIYIIVAAYSLIFPVVTLENVDASAGITRSFSLGKRRFWMVIGIGLILAIIGGLIGFILGGTSALLVFSVTPGNSMGAQVLLITVLSLVVNILILPLTPIAFTLLYYDIRTRTEGLDIMLDSSGPGARPANLPTPDSSFGLDGHDWRNIAIMTVVALVGGLLMSATIQAFINQFSQFSRR